MELFLLFRQLGPLVLVAAFFLWEGWAWETCVSERITKLEDEYQRGLGVWRYSRPYRGDVSGRIKEVGDVDNIVNASNSNGSNSSGSSRGAPLRCDVRGRRQADKRPEYPSPSR